MLTDRERERYRRRIALIREEGQERLVNALVVVGAGGPGCPAALDPAAAGPGEIRQGLSYHRETGRGMIEAAAGVRGDEEKDAGSCQGFCPVARGYRGRLHA